MSLNGELEIKLLSSLSKVFADEKLTDIKWEKGSMLSNEVYSFQAAYKWSGTVQENVQVLINSEISSFINIRSVGLIPSQMPCYEDHDDNVLRTEPGLFPDILLPLENNRIKILPNQWNSLWITVNLTAQSAAKGMYPIEIVFIETSGVELGKATFNLEVLDASLPQQKLIHTEWFHTDCIATYYGLEVFSEGYWNRVGQFMRTAAEHGINMILTPLFTPPLDTEIGGERPTVQLVDIEKVQDNYNFKFDKLKQWIELSYTHGIKYFEFSHFFTQWGAKHAPKIVALEDGNMQRIFGWDTDASGQSYVSFLSQFLPELINFLKQNNLENSCYFHVSDEPGLDDLNDYMKASDIINKYLKDYPIIDALSDYKFYETKIVKKPIPATDHIEPFLANNVLDLWAYYCCAQHKQVANRFFNMPSSRNRILGIQLYKFNIKGFLHWGYNFWFSRYSKFPIDPFKVTDAANGFPSGDAFLVYPGHDGPLESLRLEVLFEAFQDLRSLELLEKLIGRESVINLLEEGLEHPITFSEYPHDAEWLLQKREQINQSIKANC